MSKPIAVLISDVHYSLSTYKIADQAFRAAIDKAAELNVPLIDCGDLTNDKAILRGEVVNTLIETMEYAKTKNVDVTLIVGNHSLINEKSSEHTLNFLEPYCQIVSTSTQLTQLGYSCFSIPYCYSNEQFHETLRSLHNPKLLITHQGYLGAQMGDYIKDTSSIDPELVKNFTVFSGHYHRHQTIGTVTYVGNPYTLSFGEANDPPKGFLVLNDDYTFERIILNLRKHVILEVNANDLYTRSHSVSPEDLVWVKVRGTETELKKIKKQELGELLLGHSNFKLDLIYTDSKPLETKSDTMTGHQIFDALIENKGENVEELKRLWRTLV